MSGPEEMSREELIVLVRVQAGQIEAQAGQIEAQAGQIEAQAGQIEAQAGQIEAQAGQITELVEANEALVGKLARLEHLLSRNSGNSSNPPSRDEDPGKPVPPERNRCGQGGPRAVQGQAARSAGVASGLDPEP